MSHAEHVNYTTIGEDVITTLRPIWCPNNLTPSDRSFIRRGKGILDGDGAPVTDRMTGWIRNGYYQHILSLGTCSFVICNHCDHEILLVDPWPTYHSDWVGHVNSLIDERPLTHADQGGVHEARSRLAALASFLRRGVQDNYRLTGILLSHMHFDHADDIMLLLELLTLDRAPGNPSGPFEDEPGGLFGNEAYTHFDCHNRGYRLEGPPLGLEQLPKIYCDFDAMFYLLTYYLGVNYREIFRQTGINPDEYFHGNTEMRQALDEWTEPVPEGHSGYDNWQALAGHYRFVPGQRLANNQGWYEINNGARLYYDDSYNETQPESGRCVAGQRAQPFPVGQFEITPYVWDHLNTGANWFWAQRSQRALDEQTAGSLQRTTAFGIQRREIQGARNTLIIIHSAPLIRSSWLFFNHLQVA